MDSDSQSDKPPQEHFSRFTHVLGTIIAFITLATPIIAIILFSTPSTKSEPLASSHHLGDYPEPVAEVANAQE